MNELHIAALRGAGAASGVDDSPETTVRSEAPPRQRQTATRVALRDLLRAIASERESTALVWQRIRQLRPFVEAECAHLVTPRRNSGSAAGGTAGRTRLTDGVVIGLTHLARVSVGDRPRSMVPPLAAAWAGTPGPAHLSAGQDPELLLVVPEADPLRTRGERMAGFVSAALAEIGLPLRCAIDTVAGFAAEIRARPTASGTPVPRVRFVWGRYGLYRQLLDRLDPIRHERSDRSAPR